VSLAEMPETELSPESYLSTDNTNWLSGEMVDAPREELMEVVSEGYHVLASA
jgi:hypothetical protein